MAVTTRKRATLKEVAQAAGVSIASVSNVLNERGYVGEKARNRILDAIEHLGYRQNRAAKSLKTGEFPLIGVVLPNVSNLFYTSLVESLMDECRKYKMAICLLSTKDKAEGELECVDYLLSHDVMGIIWCAPLTDEVEIEAKIRDFPTVFIGRELEKYDCIVADDYQGGYELGKLGLSRGHSKIGVVTGPLERDIVKKRQAGLEAAIKGRAEIIWQYQSDFSNITPENIIATIMRCEATLVVMPNDFSAINLMKILTERGVRIPQDVSFVGYDNSDLCEYIQPSLTSVGQPRQSIAEEAIQCLIERTKTPDKPSRTIVKPIQVEVRDSVKYC
ncbi:HTH-type transcriptional repressor PurR [Paraglaciecola mesophila]|uniref:HTH-type transcriptional repressor PurR n=1 Tax=Paraglaciecola mesophila TaxID=197222 RepID=A0A857JG40_9ALTE|nr:LacI family DNA-binding transcriptional regulator [Paraglaciecola mesophila]QHJ10999.1 HTH-type transcriptional repressor PurR [Paraglaciecola mesophila]